TGRSRDHVALVEADAREQGIFHTTDTPEPVYSDMLELDLSVVEPSMAGPRRPQERIPLSAVKKSFVDTMALVPSGSGSDTGSAVQVEGRDFELDNGAVVIAAITSCTNTSNPTVMIAAGLVAKKA